VKNKKMYIFIAIIVPLLLLIQVWQSVQYEYSVQEVDSLYVEERNWYEQIKSLLAGIVHQSSPRRVDEIAGGELELERNPIRRLLHIFFRKDESP
jgi:hypothetical protein